VKNICRFGKLLIKVIAHTHILRALAWKYKGYLSHKLFILTQFFELFSEKVPTPPGSLMHGHGFAYIFLRSFHPYHFAIGQKLKVPGPG